MNQDLKDELLDFLQHRLIRTKQNMEEGVNAIKDLIRNNPNFPDNRSRLEMLSPLMDIFIKSFTIQTVLVALMANRDLTEAMEEILVNFEKMPKSEFKNAMLKDIKDCKSVDTSMWLNTGEQSKELMEVIQTLLDSISIHRKP